MGNKTLIRLLAALVVVGVLALIVHLTGAGKLERGKREDDIDRKLVIEKMRPAEIIKVRMTTVGNELNFVRSDEGWVVVERDNYPADGKAIDGLLLTASRLNIRQQPSLSSSSLGSVELLDPVREGAEAEDSATVLTFIGEDGKEKGEVWLGKVYEVTNGRPGMFGSGGQDVGRFVRTGESETVFLVEETFADIKTEASEWLDDSFFSVSQVKSVSRDTGNPEQDWTLVREDAAGDFSLKDSKAGEELDVGKVGTMKNAFASPRFEDVLTGEEAKEKPEAVTFSVETFEGFVYTVKASEKDPAGELKLTVDASVNFDEKREVGPEESDEEKKRLDDAFAADLKAKQDKLAEVKQLATRVFRTRSYFVDNINKDRSEILKSAEDSAGAGASAAPGLGGLPGLNLPGLGLPSGHPTIPPAPTPKPKPEPKPVDEPTKDSAEEATSAVEDKTEKSKAKDKGKGEGESAPKVEPAKPSEATKPEATKPVAKPESEPNKPEEKKPAEAAKPAAAAEPEPEAGS